MSVQIRRGSARFTEKTTGRLTQHALSYSGHHDPDRLGFGPMVCHDDHLLGAGRGFDLHRHSDLEIVTYVVAGALRHTDGSGESVVVPTGSVAVLSAGPEGVEHAEHATKDGPCRFVQAWLRPVEGEGEPGYAVARAALGPAAFSPIAQPRLDAVLWAAQIEAGESVEVPAAARVHVFVATGGLTRSSMAEPLVAGDAFEMVGEPAHTVTAGVPTLLLVWAFYEQAAPVFVGLGGRAGWFAYSPLDADEGESEPPGPPVGQLRLMGDYGGAFLWDEEGNIGGGEGDFTYLREHLGLSRELYDDLAAWGEDWDGQANTPEHDQRGRELVERLRAECPAYEFVLRL